MLFFVSLLHSAYFYVCGGWVGSWRILSIAVCLVLFTFVSFNFLNIFIIFSIKVELIYNVSVCAVHKVTQSYIYIIFYIILSLNLECRHSFKNVFANIFGMYIEMISFQLKNCRVGRVEGCRKLGDFEKDVKVPWRRKRTSSQWVSSESYLCGLLAIHDRYVVGLFKSFNMQVLACHLGAVGLIVPSKDFEHATIF